MWVDIFEFISGIYMLWFGMIMSTTNIKSFIIFKGIPTLLAIGFIIISVAHFFGWPLFPVVR